MTARWLDQPERGSGLLLRVIVWLALAAGRPLARALLYPICAYFIAVSPRARAASRRYLRLALARPVRPADLFRHFHCFAATILDRVFFLTGRFDRYRIEIAGAEALWQQLDRGRGCILLGAHLGSFEVVRALGILRAGLPVKILMHVGNARRINAVLDRLNPEVASTIIPLGGPEALLRVKECLEAGGIVGILGDRIVKGDKLVRTTLLGRPALLPAGPLLLAGILKVPVVLFFGLYRGDRRYEIRFEAFADQVPLGRRAGPAEWEHWVGRYAARLEHHCRSAPFNWFNFYDFWEPADDAG